MAGIFYRNLIRPALFTQEAERIHDRTIHGLGVVSRHPFLCQCVASIYSAPPLPVDLFGLNFWNPVGLAAGMDKFAEAICAWPALGFGFSELGGVTRHEQPGNPTPRLFRAIRDEAVVNAMGFNNPGADKMAATLQGWKERKLWPNHPVGMNLGKSKITPLTGAAEDYAYSFRLLRPYIDFFVVNVSSPNTPNLRQLQDKDALAEIFGALQELNTSPARPILVKVAPDLTFEALDEILELVQDRKIAGIVATNTTVSRPETSDPKTKQIYAQAGGLSGRPLRQRSTEVILHLHAKSGGAVPIIGVGGIFTADDAWEKITAGASLLQIYTSLIYEGPGVIKEIVAGIRQKLATHGFERVAQAVGLAHSNPDALRAR